MCTYIKAVLCDVDGTFIDSFNHGLHKLRLAAEAAGYVYTDEIEQTAVRAWGNPLVPLLQKCFPDADSDTITSMVDLFTSHDMENPPGAIEGVHAVFEILSSIGIMFTVVTSRDGASLDRILRNVKLDHHFIHIASEDTVTHKKPDPRVFDCTMRLLTERGISASECLLIGDTNDDWNAGQNFGMRTVIVRTGPLNTSQDHIPEEDHIESFADLPDWLRKNNLIPVD